MGQTQSIYTVSDLKPVASDVFLITFHAPEIAEAAKPGQFVHIKCGHSRPLRRPFGIADVSGDKLTVIFEVRGEGTRWLASRHVGRRVDIFGPLGNGFSRNDGNILLVGGGLGASPLLYTARTAKGSSKAVLGFGSRARVILQDEFEEACGIVFVTTDDGSYGLRGTVVKPVRDLLRNESFDAVLACGPVPMLKAVSEVAEHYEIPCEVSLEERMGCGIGACVVCACKTVKDGEERMSRVCRDGPVFDSREVMWNG